VTAHTVARRGCLDCVISYKPSMSRLCDPLQTIRALRARPSKCKRLGSSVTTRRRGVPPNRTARRTGYLLIGVTAAGFGVPGPESTAIFHLAAYVATTLGAFTVASWVVSRTTRCNACAKGSCFS
jgi:hypothetical protein